MSQIPLPFWASTTMLGYEGLMVLIATRPDLVAYACQRFMERTIQEIRDAAAMGASGIWLEECMTDMISPKAFEEINIPLVKAVVEEIRSLNMKSIYYYTGNPHGKWDHILSCGADALALEAISLIAGSLRTAVADGSNEEARCHMSEAAMLGGIMIVNSGTTAVHAMAYPLGARFHVPHGVANSLLLPYVMEQNFCSNL